MTLTDLARQDQINRQSLFESRKNCMDIHANTLRPFAYRQRQSVVRENPIATHIARLLRFSGPATIVRRVIAVVVRVSIQCVSPTRSEPHISQEVLEGMSPSLAHKNSPTSISRKIPVSCVVAPLVHHLPNTKLAGVCLAVCLDSRVHIIRPQTSTRLRDSVFQASGQHATRSSAFASTNPRDVVFLPASERYNSPTPKDPASDVRSCPTHY